VKKCIPVGKTLFSLSSFLAITTTTLAHVQTIILYTKVNAEFSDVMQTTMINQSDKGPHKATPTPTHAHGTWAQGQGQGEATPQHHHRRQRTLRHEVT